MKAYRVRGRFRMGRDWQGFAKEVAAADDAAARERILSVLGSQHGVARKYIEIAGVDEVAPADVRDPAVRHTLEVRR
ncbi:MAG TPA: 50S ribosomal protein L18Ae [Thermoplasmata archaeon]|nr:50S ribosomal protein L18Ae [Thermoplasmata archaeon]